MFSKIRTQLATLTAAVIQIADRLEDLSEGIQTPERLSALEGELAKIKGEARGLIQEAEARFAAARASEERNRHQVKRLERLQEFDEGDEEGDLDFEEWAELIQARDAERGPERGVPPVHQNMDLAGEAGEAIAEAYKWRNGG